MGKAARQGQPGVERYLIAPLLLFASLAGVQGSTPSDWYYVAAVVDFSPPYTTQLSPEENMLQNIETAGGFMANASAENADIILFPEMGMVGGHNLPFYVDVPDPEDFVNPCFLNSTNSSSVMRELSCLANKHTIYLVVNLPEKFPCPANDSTCPSIGVYHYNTNVVFDRSGVVIARYRKWNLFGESTTQKTPSVEYVTFNTDFGVIFGTFICFDILFEKPALHLVRNLGVTDIVFTSEWFSEVPYLTAVQTQAAWAHALDVNLLASGYNYPPVGSTGTGIYRGRNGPIATVVSGVAESTLLVRRVPKKGHWPEGDAVIDPSLLDPTIAYEGEDPYVEMQNISMLQDHLAQYNTSLLERPAPGEELAEERTLCSGSLCCHFHVAGRGLNLFRAASAAGGGLHRNHLYDLFFSSADSASSSFNLTEAEDSFDGFYYRLAVFQGVRDHSGVATTGVQVCSIIACLSEELASCGYTAKGAASPLVTWTEFTDVSIRGHFTAGRFYMPDTQVGPRFRPLPPSAYLWDAQSDSAGEHYVHLQLQRSVLDLRTLAIYGRVFQWDGLAPTGANATSSS